jgi:tRNA(Ile)-lysidine synthase
MVRLVIEHIRGDLRQIEFGHIERILQMATASEGHDRVQIPGVDVIRSFGWIRFAPLGYDHDRGRDYNIHLEVPGWAELPDRPGRITLQLQEMAGRDGAYVTVGDELDWPRLNSLPALDGVRSGLELRNWRPGDQYRRVGQSHEEKIKQLFQEFRVPLWERRFWPIITYHGKIVWTRRFGVAQEYAPSPSTRLVLRVGEANPLEKGSRDGVL